MKLLRKGLQRVGGPLPRKNKAHNPRMHAEEPYKLATSPARMVASGCGDTRGEFTHSIAATSSAPYRIPHSFIRSNTGVSRFPSPVREYSTFGGTTG